MQLAGWGRHDVTGRPDKTGRPEITGRCIKHAHAHKPVLHTDDRPSYVAVELQMGHLIQFALTTTVFNRF